jgi:hypothetical protein
MKKIFSLGLISAAFLVACEPTVEKPADWSSMAVIHASPVSTTVPTDTLHVFIDNARYNSANILYNTSSGYLPVLAGSKAVDIRRGITSTSSNYVSTFNYTFERGKAVSFFVYDTTTSATGQAKVLRLKDDLTLPAANMSHIRFLHLAPRGQAVDLTLVRTSVTPNDSVTMSNRSYIGASPSEENLAPFMAVPRGTYTIKVKAAGTQTVLLSSANFALTTGLNITEGRISTLWLTGSAKNRPLALGNFRHY